MRFQLRLTICTVSMSDMETQCDAGDAASGMTRLFRVFMLPENAAGGNGT
jgi:hypothetical protein